MIYFLVLVIGAAVSYFGPWWVSFVIAWIVCRWRAKNTRQAIWQSAAALLTLWLGMALLVNLSSGVDMSTKMTGILTGSSLGISPVINPILIYGITAVLSALLGALSGFAGYRMKTF